MAGRLVTVAALALLLGFPLLTGLAYALLNGGASTLLRVTMAVGGMVATAVLALPFLSE